MIEQRKTIASTKVGPRFDENIPASSGRLRSVKLVLLAMLAQGCERCTVFSSSAEVSREAGPHQVRLRAQAHREIGVDGVGAPHVGGVIWPTIAGHGYVVTAHVDDRPEVTLSVTSTPKQASKEDLGRALGAFEIAGAPNGLHVAAKDDKADWLVLHLLPVGSPFDGPGSRVATLDWASIDTPEAIAVAAVRDGSKGNAASHPLLWKAVLAQPPGEPWDSAILEAWPAVADARAWAASRAEKTPAPSDAWRQSASKRALTALTAKQETDEAAALVVSANVPASTDAMDRLLLGRWLESSLHRDAYEAYWILLQRLSCQVAKAGVLSKAPVNAAVRAAIVEKARGVFAARHVRDEAAALLVAAGSAEDRAWLDEAVLAQWPDGHPSIDRRTGIAESGVQEQLVARAAGRASTKCGREPQPLSAEMRKRIREKVRSLLSNPEHGEQAADVAVALGTQPELDLGLDVWLASFPESRENDVMDTAERGSDAWKTRTRGRMDAMRNQAKVEIAGGIDEPKARRRLEWSSTLLFQLEQATADCDRLKDLLGTALVVRKYAPKLPPRCS